MPDFADVTPLLYRHERQERVVPDMYDRLTQQRIRQYERHGGYSSYLLNGSDASVRWNSRHEPHVDTSASSPSLTFPQPYASKPTAAPLSTDASLASSVSSPLPVIRLNVSCHIRLRPYLMLFAGGRVMMGMYPPTTPSSISSSSRSTRARRCSPTVAMSERSLCLSAFACLFSCLPIMTIPSCLNLDCSLFSPATYA